MIRLAVRFNYIFVSTRLDMDGRFDYAVSRLLRKCNYFQRSRIVLARADALGTPKLGPAPCQGA